MDHLHLDGDHVLAGHDGVVVVVEYRQHRRTRAGAEGDQASLGQRPALRPIEVAHLSELRLLRGEGRGLEDRPAGFRRDQDRGPRLARHAHDLRSGIDPEIVVAAGDAGEAGHAAVHLIDLQLLIGGQARLGVALGGDALGGIGLGLGQHQPLAELRVPLEPSDGRRRPDPRHVRMAPGVARRLVTLGRHSWIGHGQRRRGGERHGRCADQRRCQPARCSRTVRPNS